jgi:hypothetical protein
VKLDRLSGGDVGKAGVVVQQQDEGGTLPKRPGDVAPPDEARRLINDRLGKHRTMRWLGTGHDAIPSMRESTAGNPMERIIPSHAEPRQPYKDL